MPKLSNNLNKCDPIEKLKPSEKIGESSNYDSEIECLKKTNEELMTKMSQIMDMFKEITTSKKNDFVEDLMPKDSSNENGVMENIKSEYPYTYTPQEINPNKQIMIMSLCYGSLNLIDDSGTTVLKFTRYGETRPVLYSVLMSIVNTNRRFAEVGKFYILNKDAVYHLGLSEFYRNLIPKEIIDNILEYSPNTIESIIKSIDSEQKEILIRTLIDKVYLGNNADISKIIFIGKICNIDIMEKVKEMQKYKSDSNL